MNLTDIFTQIAHLRDPEKGCPWDKKQVLENYLEPIREEADELIKAIENNDIDNICEEAGDLLWNICFVISLAEEKGLFKRNDVAERVFSKMKNRHPHVFGDVKADTPEEALKAFKNAKAKEK
ncbi:MAG: MazG nucleotide pyrophosphohydrolase domain-containing protein [Planctomycetota bacterium]|jgi:uncharacterized protein YabN with tetrapyrrole methylase and pyrophosphatase domain